MASGDTKTEQMLNVLANGGDASQFSGCCNTKTQNYILGAIDRVQSVEDEVEELKNNPDVVDIVDTYADLQAYDTSTLTDKDIIRVLEDSTHGNGSTYYRWNATTNQFDYIGEAGGGGDTVYSTKTTSNSGDGGAVYIGGKNANQDIYPDPTVTDNHRRYFWALPSNSDETAYTITPGQDTINIGGSQLVGGEDNVTIGYRSRSYGSNNVNIGFQAGSELAYGSCVCVGASAACRQNYGVALGREATVNQNHTGSVALGCYSGTTRKGEVYVGTSQTYAGYDSTNYRVIGGVHDPVDAHDAATKGYVDANAGSTIYLAYYPGSEPDPSDVRIYANAALTTELTGGDFWNILASGKPVVLRFNDTSQNEFYIFSLLYSHLPSENTTSGFDGYPPEAYFSDGPSGSIIQIACTGGDPTSPYFGIYVINQ